MENHANSSGKVIKLTKFAILINKDICNEAAQGKNGANPDNIDFLSKTHEENFEIEN